MDIGGFDAGLSALDAVRLRKNPDGSQVELIVDSVANARLFEFDIHYRKNKLGSAVELPI